MAVAMWRPVTVGEELFKHLLEDVGQHTHVENSRHGLDYLLSPERFIDHSRLTVTLELFLRAIRCAVDAYAQIPNGTIRQFGQKLRLEADFPGSFVESTTFCEGLKHAGRVVSEARALPKQIEKNILRDGGTDCYLCGRKFNRQSNRDRATVDHIWPMLFAGENVEDNLILACADCNHKKKHAITWVWGPVHYTYEMTSPERQVPWELRLSLALARLMSAATKGGRRLTLKEAAAQIRPAVPRLNMHHGRSHLFFEFLSHVEADA